MTKKGKQKSNRKHKRLSAEIVLKYLSQRTEPASTKAIAETLGRAGKDGRNETFAILEQLRDQQKVIQIKRHRWAMPGSVQTYQGRVVGHVDGHGYVIAENTNERVYLRSHDMREVLHNDIVQVKITGRDRRKKLLGQITKVVERGNDTIVGRFFIENGVAFVVPNDQRIGQDIFIPPENYAKVSNINDGQVVVCTIIKQPSRHFQPVGEVAEVLGDYLAPGMEIDIAIRKHHLPHEWPDNVNKQTQKLDDEVNEKDFADRKDIRDLPLVTIDGEDARDFDDAVYCEKLEQGGYRLIVAIADVSHYVKPESALDIEAWQRGNSVYFPQQVIPMLPEILSNGLCSLNPQVNRLCFTCDMQITEDGEIDNYDFYPAVMYSHARLTYTQVAAFIGEDGDTEHGISEELLPHISNLYALSKCLNKRRKSLGMIEFDIPEPVIMFNDERKIEQILPRVRNDAHRLIEECMLAANICASICLDDSDLAGIYRVHDSPDTDKIEDVRHFLRQFKLLLPGGEEPEPQHYAAVVSKITDAQTAKIVQTALLRSMKQARYSADNDGHFALNFDSYTHFTSPIRRYADLVVHRQLKRFISDHTARDEENKLIEISKTADQVSITERRADDATRDAIQWLKCEYMSHKIGERLWGTVSSVTDFGLFVELEDVYVDGLVHITSLVEDYYRYDQERRLLIGESSGRVYRMGQRLEIQVSRVDMEQCRIDFALVEGLNQKHHSAKNKKYKKYKKKRK